MGKILKNKDSKEMGYEDEKYLEIDEDSKALIDEIQKEYPILWIKNIILQNFFKDNNLNIDWSYIKCIKIKAIIYSVKHILR